MFVRKGKGKGSSESLDSRVFNLSERVGSQRRFELFVFFLASLEASQGGECLLLIVPNRFCGSVSNKDGFGECLTP